MSQLNLDKVINTNSGGLSSVFDDNTEWVLHFLAPLYWKSGDLSSSDADIPTSMSSMYTVGSEDINWVMFALTKPWWLSQYEYDWFDSTNRSWPYYDAPSGYITFSSAVTHTIYRNIISERYLKEWVVVWREVNISFGRQALSPYISSSRCRFHVSLIDFSWVKTAISTSVWYDLWTQSSHKRTWLLNVSSSGIVVVGSDKKLFIEIEYEGTNTGWWTSNFMFDSGSLTSTTKYYTWVFVSCTVE